MWIIYSTRHCPPVYRSTPSCGIGTPDIVGVEPLFDVGLIEVTDPIVRVQTGDDGSIVEPVDENYRLGSLSETNGHTE